MNRKKVVFIAFILVALAQLYVPAKMILDKETVLEKGTVYRFKTAPIDPNDPFRGKYIMLDYVNDTVVVSNEEDWTSGQMVYASLSTDHAGFARVESISKEKPTDGRDFIEAKVGYIRGNGSNKLTIDYPFDRYYMEESKAYDAERLYTKSLLDTTQVTYALVSVKDGDAVLEDILINEIPIKEIVEKNKK